MAGTGGSQDGLLHSDVQWATGSLVGVNHKRVLCGSQAGSSDCGSGFGKGSVSMHQVSVCFVAHEKKTFECDKPKFMRRQRLPRGQRFPHQKVNGRCRNYSHMVRKTSKDSGSASCATRDFHPVDAPTHPFLWG